MLLPLLSPLQRFSASAGSALRARIRPALLSSACTLLAACSSTSNTPQDTPDGGAGGAAGNGSGGVAAGGAGNATSTSSGGSSAGTTQAGGGSESSGTGGAAGSAGLAGSAGTAAGGTSGGAPQGGQSGGGAATGGTAGQSGSSAGSAGAAGATGASCMTPPGAPSLVGWATVEGLGRTGTDGGGTTAPVTVSTLAAFNSAAAGTAPKVIYVTGTISGVLKIGSNKTVVGLCGAKLQGHVSLSKAVNVIVRNITIVGNNCTDSPGECGAGADAVTIGDTSHHVWFDHCDIYDGSDGNLDITSGADFVTISWSRFHYTTARTDPVSGTSGHRFSNLVGSADDVPADVGHLNVTFHHNWWGEHVDQRMPRTRHGKIHVVNNLFTAVGNSYCSNSGFEATLLVENNVYVGVKNPLQPDVGNMLARGNVFEGTTGTMTASGTGFTPPYALTPEPVADLPAAIMAGSGPH